MKKSHDEEVQQCRNFVEATKRRKAELEEKKKNKTMNRAEMFELDMCNGDIKRWTEWLNIHDNLVR